MKQSIILIMACLINVCITKAQEGSIDNDQHGTFTDERDGQTYKWVEIGNQIWMAENLNFGKSNYYCYKGNIQNCETFGKLYPWKKAKKACPTSWHLPDDTEWVVLTDFLGGESIAGGKMKEIGIMQWETPNASATNSSGFTAIPGGYRDQTGYCFKLGTAAYFWSSSEADLFQLWVRSIENGISSVDRIQVNKKNSLSIRCIKDE